MLLNETFRRLVRDELKKLNIVYNYAYEPALLGVIFLLTPDAEQLLVCWSPTLWYLGEAEFNVHRFQIRFITQGGSMDLQIIQIRENPEAAAEIAKQILRFRKSEWVVGPNRVDLPSD
ncbi:MAG: hypothetical protein WC831_02005 [Parcubacteria group bacterium]|jgi:hypothetical protein